MQKTPMRILLALILGVALVARCYGLGDLPFWLDEGATYFVASGAREDHNHPPLYYGLLSLWLGFGDSEVVLRAMSVVFGVLTVPFVFGLGRALGGARLGLVAALLFALAPYQIQYAQEARMYALFTFAASAAMCGLAWMMQPPDGGRWSRLRGPVAYVLGTTVALYTHYTAPLLWGASNVAFLVASRCAPLAVKPWLGAQLAVALLWLPGALAFLATFARLMLGFWMPPVDLAILADAVGRIHLAFWVEARVSASLFLLALAAIGVWSWRRKYRPLLLATSLLVVPFAAEIAVSWWSSVFVHRVLIWTAIPFLLLVARGALALPHAALRAAAVAGVLAIELLGIAGYHERYRKDRWDQAAAHVAANLEDGDLLVFLEGWAAKGFHYYFRRAHRPVDQHLLASYELTPAALEGLAGLVSEHGRVWYVLHPPEGEAARGPVLEVARRLGTEVDHRSFFRVEVHLFENR